MKQLTYLFSLLVLLAAVSCRDTGRTTTTTGTEASDLNKSEQRLRAEVIMLKDSIDSNWQQMSESDERKMASVRRLLDEISYTPKFNSLRQRQLTQAHQRVKSLRYDMQTMANSEIIDRYDAAQDSLISGTLDLASVTPEVEKYPLVNELANDIQNEHNKIIIYRIQHDTYARELNKMLEQNERKIKKMGAPVSNLQRVPLFTISGT